MNGRLPQEDCSYLQLPTTELDDKKHNGIVTSSRDLSVSMPNIAMTHLSLHQSSHVLPPDEQIYNNASLLCRIKLYLCHKLTFMKEITSFDGLRFVTTNYSARLRVPLWLTIFFISVAFMIWGLYNISEVYFDRATFFSRTKHFPASLKFPAITICNHNPYYDISVYSDEFNSLSNETQAAIFYEFYRKDRLFDVSTSRLLEIINDSVAFDIFTEQFNQSVNIETILRQHGHKLEGGLLSCSFDGRECGIQNFTEIVTAYGLCYTLDFGMPNYNITRAGTSHGLSLIINIEQSRYMYYTSHTAGLQVFVHPQDEYPYSGEFHGFSVPPGFETQVAISLTDTKLLEPPYGQCGDRPIHDTNIFPCTAAQSSNSTMTNSTTDDMMQIGMRCPQPIKRYTRQRCLDECEALYQNRRCGCKADYLPGGDIRVCNLNELFNCLLNVTDQFAEVKNSVCDCPVECRSIQYNTRLSRSYLPADYYPRISGEAIRSDFLSILFYFDQLEYTEVTEKPEYSASRFIADIGNHVALFTGAGVLTFFELFELCCHN